MKVKEFALAAALLACHSAFAADLTVASTIGVREAIERVRQDFERSGPYHLNIRYGLAPSVKRRLDDGDSFDVAILTRPMIDDLANQGKVIKETSATLARVGIAIAVKHGSAKAAIGSHDSLRHSLLAAREIAYRNEGPSQVTAERVFDVLGIAEEIKNRVYLDPRPAGGLLAVEEGKADIAFATMSEISLDSGVDLVGPLPGDLQTYVVFAAGISSSTKDRQACQAFITFLRAREVRRALKNMGMQVSD